MCITLSPNDCTICSTFAFKYLTLHVKLLIHNHIVQQTGKWHNAVYTCLDPRSESTNVPRRELQVPLPVRACCSTGCHSRLTTFCRCILSFLFAASL